MAIEQGGPSFRPTQARYTTEEPDGGSPGPQRTADFSQGIIGDANSSAGVQSEPRQSAAWNARVPRQVSLTSVEQTNMGYGTNQGNGLGQSDRSRIIPGMPELMPTQNATGPESYDSSFLIRFRNPGPGTDI